MADVSAAREMVVAQADAAIENAAVKEEDDFLQRLMDKFSGPEPQEVSLEHIQRNPAQKPEGRGEVARRTDQSRRGAIYCRASPARAPGRRTGASPNSSSSRHSIIRWGCCWRRHRPKAQPIDCSSWQYGQQVEALRRSFPQHDFGGFFEKTCNILVNLPACPL